MGVPGTKNGRPGTHPGRAAGRDRRGMLEKLTPGCQPRGRALLYHRRPFVGVSNARSWSRLLVLGAILWAFIAKN